MEFVRFRSQQGMSYGVIKGNQIIRLAGDIFGDSNFLNDYYLLSEVELLPPVMPKKLVCVGLNYCDHAKELGLDLPQKPVIFLKPPTAVIGPQDKIKIPESSQQVDYEAELAVVIKDQIKDLQPGEVEKHILGYTCFNDVTARDLQEEDGQWTRAKSFDTFAPLGPKIVTDLEPHNLDIELLVNREKQQASNTSQMAFSIREIVSFISRIMTLQPGDIIATGTPPGVGTMNRGDRVEVKIEGVGSLVNQIV